MGQPWEASAPQRVECPAAREPAVRRTIVAAALIGLGLWCYMDRNKYTRPDDWSLKNVNDVSRYVFNNWGPYAFLPAGVAVLIWMAAGMRKKLIADEEGIGYDGSEKIAWDEVQKLDARKIQSKGAVTLYTEKRRLVLDSYYLTNFSELMALVEHRVPADKQVLK
jgi:hypothetical protein